MAANITGTIFNYDQWINNETQATQDLEDLFNSGGVTPTYGSQAATELFGVLQDLESVGIPESITLDDNLKYVASTLAANTEYGPNNELFSENEKAYLTDLLKDGVVNEEELNIFNDILQSDNTISEIDQITLEEINKLDGSTIFSEAKASFFSNFHTLIEGEEDEDDLAHQISEDGLQIEKIQINSDGSCSISFNWDKFWDKPDVKSYITESDLDILQGGLDYMRKQVEDMVKERVNSKISSISASNS